MGLIVFEVHQKGKRTTKNLSRELMWYEWAPRDKNGKPILDEDGKEVQGKMHKMQGGRLDFKYDFNESKLNIGTAPLKIVTYEKESNEKEIETWINANRIDLGLSKANGVGITVTFPDKNKADVKKALEDTSFSYEIV